MPARVGWRGFASHWLHRSGDAPAGRLLMWSGDSQRIGTARSVAPVFTAKSAASTVRLCEGGVDLVCGPQGMFAFAHWDG